MHAFCGSKIVVEMAFRGGITNISVPQSWPGLREAHPSGIAGYRAVSRLRHLFELTRDLAVATAGPGTHEIGAEPLPRVAHPADPSSGDAND